MTSFVLLAVGALATFSSLNTARSIIWPKGGQEASGVATLVKVRLISFGLVMGVAYRSCWGGSTHWASWCRGGGLIKIKRARAN